MKKKELEKRIVQLEKGMSTTIHHVTFIRDTLFVEDYFYDGCFTSPDKLILKSEAKSFMKKSSFLGQLGNPVKCYTTKKTYSAHINLIKKWEKEVEDWEKKNDL